jgi:hypothetical protein
MKHPRIYGVQGVYKENAINQHVQAVLSPRRYMSIKDILKYGIIKHYCASTSNVLLKRNVIRLVNPAFLCGLESGEDLYIAWRIIESYHIYIRINKMQAVHYSSPEIVLSKSLRRSFGHNGIFYGIPLRIYDFNNNSLSITFT